MKIILSGCLLFALFQFAKLAATGSIGSKSAAEEENQQLTDVIAPNPTEQNHAKRHHTNIPDFHSIFPLKSSISLPSIISISESPAPEASSDTKPKMRHTNLPNVVMSNVFSEEDKDSSTPKQLPSINLIEESVPKFVFSSLHRKLVPKDEDSREQAMVKGLMPQITAGKISLPELIQDAPDSSEMQHESDPTPTSMHIIKTTTFTRSEPMNQIFELGPFSSMEQIMSSQTSSPEEVLPFGHPYYKVFPYTVSPNEYENDHSSHSGSTEVDSILKTKKPKLMISVKSKLRLTKIKLDVSDESTTEHSEGWMSGESDEIDFDDATRNAEKERQPHCPTPTDFVRGSKNLWKGFRNSETWSDSLGAIAVSAANAADSLQLCAQRVWQGITSAFGFGDSESKRRIRGTSEYKENDPETTEPSTTPYTGNTEESSTTPVPTSTDDPKSTKSTTEKPNEAWKKTKELAGELKKGFNEKVGKPFKGFFKDLASKTKAAFSG